METIIWVILRLHWGYVGIVENEMETLIYGLDVLFVETRF